MTREEMLAVAKPILFNTEMVRAVKDNRKTVTRRVVKPQHLRVLDSPYRKKHPETPDKVLLERLCEPPYRPGDILYVRETFCVWHLPILGIKYCYKATDPNGNRRPTGPNPDDEWEVRPWHPSIHMPKEAARIFLRVTDVRVERLQDIDDDEALKEGCGIWGDVDWVAFPAEDFKRVWDSTIKPADLALYGWDANPWVWVIKFEKMEAKK